MVLVLFFISIAMMTVLLLASVLVTSISFVSFVEQGDFELLLITAWFALCSLFMFWLIVIIIKEVVF